MIIANTTQIQNSWQTNLSSLNTQLTKSIALIPVYNSSFFDNLSNKIISTGVAYTDQVVVSNISSTDQAFNKNLATLNSQIQIQLTNSQTSNGNYTDQSLSAVSLQTINYIDTAVGGNTADTQQYIIANVTALNFNLTSQINKVQISDLNNTDFKWSIIQAYVDSSVETNKSIILQYVDSNILLNNTNSQNYTDQNILSNKTFLINYTYSQLTGNISKLTKQVSTQSESFPLFFANNTNISIGQNNISLQEYIDSQLNKTLITSNVYTDVTSLKLNSQFTFDLKNSLASVNASLRPYVDLNTSQTSALVEFISQKIDSNLNSSLTTIYSFLTSFYDTLVSSPVKAKTMLTYLFHWTPVGRFSLISKPNSLI